MRLVQRAILESYPEAGIDVGIDRLVADMMANLRKILPAVYRRSAGMTFTIQQIPRIARQGGRTSDLSGRSKAVP